MPVSISRDEGSLRFPSAQRRCLVHRDVRQHVRLIERPERTVGALIGRFPAAFLLDVTLEVLQIVVASIAVLAGVTAEAPGSALTRITTACKRGFQFVSGEDESEFGTVRVVLSMISIIFRLIWRVTIFGILCERGDC